MEAALILSTWGAALSTGLAILAVLDRTRARPIIRTYAHMTSRRASEQPRFVTATIKVGQYGDEEVREFYVEFKVQNRGTKPLSLQHIYIENEKDLSYLTPEGLPIVLEGQTSVTFEIQKEHFDMLDFKSKERRKPEICEIGLVDGLDRRYPVSARQLQDVLAQSLALPTTMAFYMRREHPENHVLAFQMINSAVIKRRSAKKPSLRGSLLFWRDNA